MGFVTGESVLFIEVSPFPTVHIHVCTYTHNSEACEVPCKACLCLHLTCMDTPYAYMNNR